MRLYTNKDGSWAGTQADAKKLDGSFELAEVPTDKATLLEFLNEYAVGHLPYGRRMEEFSESANDKLDKAVEIEAALEQTFPSSSRRGLPGPHDVHDAIKNCDRKHLGQALASIISRLYDEMEEIE